MVGHIYKIKQSKSASQLHPKKTRRIRGNNIYKLAVKKNSSQKFCCLKMPCRKKNTGHECQKTRQITSSYFLSASSAKNLASLSWFSRASIRSSSDKLLFSSTLRILLVWRKNKGYIYVCIYYKILEALFLCFVVTIISQHFF